MSPKPTSKSRESGGILETQVAVIGAGPGGYAAAFRAADRGLKVVLIDARARPGGVCLHVGCIPSKALLHVSSFIEEAKEASRWGVDIESPRVDLERLRNWKNGVVDKLVSGLETLCKARGVEYVSAQAVFIDSERLRLEFSDREMVHFEKAIIATGSEPVMPPVFAEAGTRVMDSTAALELDEVPDRLLVIGAGYIGLEMATVYASLGSRVTVVEMEKQIVPGADRDLTRPVAKRLAKTCEAIHLGTKVESLEDTGSALKVRLSGDFEGELEVDRALVAIGRRPSLGGLGLENTQVKVDERGFAVVDGQRKTGDPNIYAIGDVAGDPMLAHKATREGIIAADSIAGKKVEFDPSAIPAVMFTDPELAWCGLTETQAKAQGIAIEVRRFAWGASGRALTFDRPDGMTKFICEADTQRVLGVGIVGRGAGELIAEATLGIEFGAVAEDFASTIHPHPTTSETLMEGAELFLGSATHLYRPPRKP